VSNIIDLLIVLVLTPDSHGVVNQVDHRYLAFLPSPLPTILLLEDREVGEDCLQLL